MGCTKGIPPVAMTSCSMFSLNIDRSHPSPVKGGIKQSQNESSGVRKKVMTFFCQIDIRLKYDDMQMWDGFGRIVYGFIGVLSVLDNLNLLNFLNGL